MDRRRVEELVRDYEEQVAAGVSFYMDASDLMDIAEYYIKATRHHEADNCIDLALRLHPDNEAVLLMKAYRLKDEGQWTEAMRIVNSLQGQDSREVQFFNIESCLVEMLPNEAQKLFDTLVADMPPMDYYDCYVDYAELLLDYGFYRRAAVWLQAFPETDGTYDMKRVHELRGEVWCQLHNYARAVESINQMIDVDPYDAESWAQLADVQYRAEVHHEAIDSCDYALTIDPSHVRALQIKLYAATKLGDYKVAVLAGQEFVKLRPEDYMGYMMLAEISYAQGLYGHAILFFGQAARYCPDTQPELVRILERLGECHLVNKDFSQALDAYLCALQSEGEAWQVFFQVATVAFTVSQTSQAVEILQQALELLYVLPEQLGEMAELLTQQQCYRPAETLWKRIAERQEELSEKVQEKLICAMQELGRDRNDQDEDIE